MTFFMTPLSNALCEVTRASYVSLFGSLICIIGLVLSSFASDVSILYISYSFCFGIGSSFAFFPTVVALKTYFKRYLTLANGLATSGSGLGTFTLAPIIEHCLESYGLKWTYLFLAAIVLSLVISQKMLMCVEQRHKLPQDTEQEQLLIYKIKSIVFRGDLWTDKKYVVMVASMAVFHFGYFIPYVHLVSFPVRLILLIVMFKSKLPLIYFLRCYLLLLFLYVLLFNFIPKFVGQRS